MSGWFVAYVAPNKEFEVTRDIRELGVDVYCPTRKIVRRPRRAKLRKGKSRIITVPLYPSYLFTNYQIHHKDVIGYIRMGLTPIMVPDAIINQLKRDVEKGIYDERKTREKIAEGETVEITEGPFAGKFAEYIRAGGESVYVEVVASAGRIVHISLPWFSVKKLSG